MQYIHLVALICILTGNVFTLPDHCSEYMILSEADRSVRNSDCRHNYQCFSDKQEDPYQSADWKVFENLDRRTIKTYDDTNMYIIVINLSLDTFSNL